MPSLSAVLFSRAVTNLDLRRRPRDRVAALGVTLTEVRDSSLRPPQRVATCPRNLSRKEPAGLCVCPRGPDGTVGGCGVASPPLCSENVSSTLALGCLYPQRGGARLSKPLKPWEMSTWTGKLSLPRSLPWAVTPEHRKSLRPPAHGRTAGSCRPWKPALQAHIMVCGLFAPSSTAQGRPQACSLPLLLSRGLTLPRGRREGD